jgi:hypothetical protein
MSNIIEKEVRPEKGKGKDGEVITLSKAQHDPHLADPNDFVVLQPDEGVNAEVPAHGQHGNNKSEHRKLLRKAAGDRGKSAYRKNG